MANNQGPDGWAREFMAEGVPAWAVWQAWNEAEDDDTVGSIRARALELARTRG